MDTTATGHLDSILQMLPPAECEHLTKFFNQLQKTNTLHQQLIKQLNHDKKLDEIVLNATGDGIIAVDEEHKIISLNPALANMFGYKVHELKGRDLNILLPEKAHAHHAKHIQTDRPQVLISGDNICGIHKTNGPFKVSVEASQSINGNQKICTGLVRDLTRQNQLEQENKKKTAELTNRTKELEGLYSLIKLREEESITAIIHKLFKEIVPKTTRLPDKAVTIIEMDGQVYRSRKEKPLVALTSKLHNGTLTFGFTEGVFYGTEKHQRLLDTFTGELDQTIMQVKAEQRELQAERKAAMGELSSGIAHNVNNGLQIIQGYTQIALNLARNEAEKEPLEKIRAKTQELGASVRGILQSTNYRPHKSKFEVFNLGELLSDYLKGAENPLKSEALRNGATVTINKHIGADTFINGKKAEITLITQSLIKKGIDAFLEDGQIEITVTRKGDYVHLVVKDTGIGMSEECQEKLFDSGASANGYLSGKGLSLGTAQQIAQEHGGEIRLLESRIGQGTSIELKIPYVQHQAECSGYQPLSNNELEIKPLSILWAEDDLIIKETVKMLTKSLDDQIDFVENGKKAMDQLERKKYDVLVTDIGMPVMGGWKLLRNIKGLYADMPRVVASGYIINSNDMAASGVSYLLNKPLEKDDIISIIDKIKTRHTRPQLTVVGNTLNGAAVNRAAC